MNLCIIFPSETGIAICQPMAEARRTPEETDAELAAWVAKKDVPHGVPYLIIPRSDLPGDRTDRHLWDADFANPHGHGGDQ